MLRLSRVLIVVVLSAAMLAAGLIGPAASEPAPDLPETVAEELPGLPAAARGSRVSKPVTTPMPFSMVGFEIPEGTEVEFRTSTDGETWGPWTEAHVNPDEGPDDQSDEARAANALMSEPVWVGEAGHLQTRMAGSSAKARPERARVHLIDSSGLGRSWGRRVLDRMKAAWRGTARQADAAVRKPTIVTRAQWGANESLRRGSPSYASGVVAGFVHHTAGPNSYTRAQSDDVLRGIYRYHVQSRGWSDIGYNFLIDRYGTVYEGRYGGVNRAVIGAHAGGFNTATFGVSLMGTFTSARTPAAMRSSLVNLLAWKYDIHHTNVMGRTSYTSHGSTKYAAGRSVDIHRLSGHRHVSTTSCPGGTVANDLAALRRDVRDRQNAQGGVLLDPATSPPRVSVVNRNSVSGAVRFSIGLRPAASWTLQVLNPAGVQVFAAASPPGTTATSGTASWTPTNVDRGTYTYVFSSGTRRRARGSVALAEPPLNVSASRAGVMMRADRRLSAAVTFAGSLYPNARWNLGVTDPTGRTVHSASGVSSSLSSTWSGPGTVPGRYRWTLTADDVSPRTGTFRVMVDRVVRRGNQRSRVAAAAAISRGTFAAGTAGRAVLTRVDRPAFALPAGPLAGNAGPVLYTKAGTVPAATVDELKRALNANPTLYVMGGPGVISDAAVASAVRRASGGRSIRVHRVRGGNAIAVAGRASNIVLRRTPNRNVLLVGLDGRGGWRQGIAASAAGARLNRPVLLTRRARLATATRKALARNRVRNMLVVGNTSAVPKSILRQRPAGVRLGRVGGSNPGKIAVGVSRRLFKRTTARTNDDFVFVNPSRRDGWVRVLAAAPYAARRAAPVLVTARTGVPLVTRRALNRLGYTASTMGQGSALGNADHVSRKAMDALSRHLQ